MVKLDGVLSLYLCILLVFFDASDECEFSCLPRAHTVYGASFVYSVHFADLLLLIDYD